MKNNFNLQIRHVEIADKDFWFSLDKHMSAVEFSKKVRDKQGYVLSAGDKPIGILRYNLFYRKIGYSDCGNLMIKNQRTELFLQKAL